MVEKLIKSRKRVADHGEVFTGEREVNAMLDLVKDESERIDSRFLEPACGNGNFVAAILKRKLETVRRLYHISPSDYEKYSVVAVSSIYGVDILQDNVIECRKRLFNIWNENYKLYCKDEADDQCRDAVKYIISRNILCGDALTMLQDDGNPIIFSQWDLVIGNKIKRRDYRLDQLMYDDDDLFSTQNIVHGTGGDSEFEYDEETHAWIPAPLKEYPLLDFKEVQYAD